MDSKKFFHKKLHHTVMKSPSPDYHSKNRSMTSSEPLKDLDLRDNRKVSNPTVSFPSLPINQLKKASISTENIEPSKGGAVDSDNKNNIANFISFNKKERKEEAGHQDQIKRLLEEIQSIYQLQNNIVKSPINGDFQNRFQIAFAQLQSIHNFIIQVLNSSSRENSSLTFGIKNELQDSFCITKPDSILLNQYNKLKKQLLQTTAQLQLYKKRGSQVSSRLKQSLEIYHSKKSFNLTKLNDSILEESKQDESFSAAPSQFMREKITFLEKQLELTICKFAQQRSSLNEEITSLKKQIQEQKHLHENQLKTYKQFRKTISSQQIAQNNEPSGRATPKKNRRDLMWDNDTIMSIYDQQEFPENSIYSEVEKVDYLQVFAMKREFSLTVQRLKQNQKRLKSEIISLQQQLNALKKMIELQLDQCDENHEVNCIQCTNLKLKIINQQIEIYEMQRKQILQGEQLLTEKQSNQRLRQLIEKELRGIITQKKNKGKGLEKIKKKPSKQQFQDRQDSFLSVSVASQREGLQNSYNNRLSKQTL